MDSDAQRGQKAAGSADPAEYSWSSSQSRWSSFNFALAGIVHMARYQKNTRIMGPATAAVILAGWWAGIDAMRWAVLVHAIALVWISEFINAAIEAVTNIGSPGFHPMAKVAKDVAAGAVLIASVAALLVGVFILAPPLLDKLSASLSPQ